MGGTASVEFRVLGPIEVLAGGEQVRLGGPRPRSVLGVLLVHAGQAVPVEHLIDQLWGDAPPASVLHALHVHISSLRKVLGDRLVTVASGYMVDAAPDEVDAGRFESLVAAAREQLATHPARAAEDLAAALALWKGEPYAGIPAGPDVEAARLRLAELRLSAWEDRVHADLALGRHAQVAAELAGVVLAHPTRDRLVRAHLVALYRCGRVTDAQAAFAQLVAALDEELGVDPGDEIAALARAIDRRDPTLDPPSTIPVPPSRFIGRRQELDQLADQLGGSRLLTVTGPGGAGKTRLALELARDTAADYPDGAFVVELAALPAGGEVAPRVAAAVNVWERTSEPILRSLVTRLHGARVLLVLDNCEHVVDSCAEVVDTLLRECVGVRVVATSREPLGVPGELVRPLAGLAIPAEDDTGAAAARVESVRLLADRGAAARPGFAVTAANIATARRLTRRLDGLPLAIELAAAQLRTLSLDEVAEHLGRRLDLADRRSRTTPDRHRTMRAAIDWSYQLLEPDEQALFRGLAVFVDGCVAEAAETVTGMGHDVLARLVDQSVVVAEPHPDGTRYRVLELIREYATEQLALSGQAPELRRRHARWYADFAEQSYQAKTEAARLRMVRAEVPNFRAAVRWSFDEGGDPETAVLIGASMWWYWSDHGMSVEALGWIRQGLEDPAVELSKEVYVRATRAASALVRGSGDHDRARLWGEQSLAACRELGDIRALQSALNGLAFTALAQGDYPAAERFALECRAACEEGGDKYRAIVSGTPLGLALCGQGRWEEAGLLFTEIRDWCGGAGAQPVATAAATSNLAMVRRELGDPAGARALYRESLAEYFDLGLATGQMEVLDGLAGLDCAEGRYTRALRLLLVTDREWDRFGVREMTNHHRLADRAATRMTATAALGAKAARVADSVGGLSLSAVVADVLAEEAGAPGPAARVPVG
ncbi:BTAD domain-containing putative transcriptional regulator [Longispora sp. K20-0274]|uniref:BTAD domain-containing putative transcriptional regulator n=1 Tax=Longispora sp. K20-0274 TaxID=3088255 RepID=UPI00399B96F0